jgi:hypothetical protein
VGDSVVFQTSSPSADASIRQSTDDFALTTGRRFCVQRLDADRIEVVRVSCWRSPPRTRR